MRPWDLPRPSRACHDRIVLSRPCWLALLVAALGCGNAPVAPVKGPPTEVGLAPLVERSDARLALALPSETEATVLPQPARASARFGHLESADRLSHVFEALGDLEDGRTHDDVRIVQYGDSHTASDVGSAAVRRQLQA